VTTFPVPTPFAEPWEYELRFPRDPRGPGIARATLHAVLAAHGLREMAGRAELLTSELATNAVRYADGPAGVRLTWLHPVLRISVWDTNPQIPAPPQATSRPGQRPGAAHPGGFRRPVGRLRDGGGGVRPGRQDDLVRADLGRRLPPRGGRDLTAFPSICQGLRRAAVRIRRAAVAAQAGEPPAAVPADARTPATPTSLPYSAGS
jgi:anti-sigma regulatory factor (Ser/Thr protein kinase)